MQDSLAKQNFHENMKKNFEHVTKSFKHVSAYETKIMMETFKKNNKGQKLLNKKLLEVKKDRGLLASFLWSPSPKITYFEHTSQLKLVKYPSSSRVNDLLINKTIQVTLSDNLLTFPDTDKKFERQDLLKKITNKNCILYLADLPDKKYCSILQSKCISMKELYVIKALGIHLSPDYFIHRLSWILGFQENIYQKFLMNFAKE